MTTREIAINNFSGVGGFQILLDNPLVLSATNWVTDKGVARFTIEVGGPLEWEASSDEDWLTIATSTAKSFDLLAGTEKEPYTDITQPREGTITVTFSNSETATLTVKQVCLLPDDSFYPGVILVAKEGAKHVPIALRSTEPWQVNPQCDWVRVEKLDGDKYVSCGSGRPTMPKLQYDNNLATDPVTFANTHSFEQLYLTIEPNTLTYDRQFVLHTNTFAQQKAFVYQLAKEPSLGADIPATVAFEAEAGEQEIAVSPNTVWTINNTVTWAHPAFTDDGKLVISVDANTTSAARTGSFTIELDTDAIAGIDDASEYTKTVAITQNA